MINNLVDYLKKCDEAYYGSGDILVSNDTYDSLVETLKRMDPANPYLMKVGAKPNGTNKVGRINPMGTLDKLHEDAEVLEWLSKETDSVLLAPKYDGFGVELTYIDGKLVMASTRGDGMTGEDVTDSVAYIENIPKTLPEDYKNLTCVRGECIIPREHHEVLKGMGYTAMRNAVPGIVRSCRVDALKYVNFVAYEFFDGDTDRVSQRFAYEGLFEIESFFVHSVNNFEGILADRNSLGDKKDSFKYEIDGTVLKTVDILEDDLRHPNHQIAWKFKSNRRETVLRSIEFQLGATGKFTPIAIFDPVEFQGAQLTRASLGSMDRFYDLKPSVGDMIEVSRRGDIIPYVESIIEHVGQFEPLKVCPHCGHELVNNECINKECPEIVFLQIRNFVGTLGIKGIGPALVKGLITSGVIHKISDIYNVTESDILSIPRQGQSSADKWSALISKEYEAKTFLSAMPFDNIGIKAWESLLERWDYRELMNVTEEDLRQAHIKGLGDGKITEFIRQLTLYRDEILVMYDHAKIR